jgi:hypothetical protein
MIQCEEKKRKEKNPIYCHDICKAVGGKIKLW